MFEEMLAITLLAASVVAPVVLAVALRVKNLPRRTGVVIFLLLACVEPIVFVTATVIAGHYVNASGRSSIWNGDASLGVPMVAVAMFGWSMLCALGFAAWSRPTEAEPGGSILDRD